MVRQRNGDAMILLQPVHAILPYGLVALLVWAAVEDCLRRRIPDRIVLAVAGLWGIHALGHVLMGLGHALTGVTADPSVMASGDGAIASGAGLVFSNIGLNIGGSLLSALAVFLAGLFAFRLRVLGGGDVKLLTVCALWTGGTYLMLFLAATAMAGGVLALLQLSARLVPALARRVLRGAMAGAGGGRTMGIGHVRKAPGSGEIDACGADRQETAMRQVLDQTVPYGVAIAFGGALVAFHLAGAA